MFYAIDAYPAYQEVAYQVATAAAEHSAKGFAAAGAAPKGVSGLQVAGARTHCVVHTQDQGGIAVCDDATIISFGNKGAKAHPAVFKDAGRGQLTPANFTTRPAASYAPAYSSSYSNGAIDASNNLSSPTRRWFADLLMTFGVGFLLVSAFLFVTSRDPLPTRR